MDEAVVAADIISENYRGYGCENVKADIINS